MPVNLKLLQTSTFRLAAAYLVVFALSVGVVLAYVYWNTAGLLERQIQQTIEAEVQGLAEQYGQRGLGGLVEIVSQRSSRETGSVYLLANDLGRRMAGNLDALPAAALEAQRGWIEFPYAVETAHGTERHQARAFHIELTDGTKLLVGRDVEERRQFAVIIRNTLFWALAFTLVIGTAGGLLMSRNFLRRVDAITATSRSIRDGDLTERVPISGTGDELDRLAENLNEMLEQIERLMTAMREVSGNLAHDLRSPLARLRARVEDALRSNDPDADRRALRQTLEEADGLLTTFNALLSIARTEAGQAREGLAVVELGPLVEEIAELYAPSAEEQGGSLTVTAAPGIAARADRQLFAQALANVIDNALKYGWSPDRQPEITVTLAEADGSVITTVADRGPGVPEKDRERVLDRFVRLDESRSKPGNGLGLSLAAGIMKLHQGRILLEDNAPGLKVKLILPAAA